MPTILLVSRPVGASRGASLLSTLRRSAQETFPNTGPAVRATPDLTVSYSHRRWRKRSFPFCGSKTPGERSRGTSSLDFRSSGSINSSRGFRCLCRFARGRVRIYLSEHIGDATPNTLIHLNVNDIDSIAAVLGVSVDEKGLAAVSAMWRTRTATAFGSPLLARKPRSVLASTRPTR